MGTDIVVINNITLKINPTSIMSRQKRRLVKEEYIRENSIFSHMGKYSDPNFTILLQFNMDDEIRSMNSPEALPDMLKLLCQIDNFPFLYIRSKKIESYLTQTSETNLDQMIFGLESYSIYYSSDTNNILTLKLDIKYFNHVPLTSDLSFYSMSKGVDSNTRSKIINETVSEEQTITSSGDIRDSEVFDRYFYSDYVLMYERISAYKGGKSGSRNLSDTKIRYPVFLDSEPENDDYSKMEIKTVDINNDIDSKSIYATWKDSGDISKIGDSNSPINNISITKYNNFASHSMTSWAYPVLQYMGKGMTRLDLSFNEDSLNGYSLKYLKVLLSKIDANQLDFYRYSQFNILKIDNILIDLIPTFGFILDSEFIKSSSDLQGVDQASFSFMAKDVGDLIERKGYISANTRSTKISVPEMINTISAIIDHKDTTHCATLSAISTRTGTDNRKNYNIPERLRDTAAHSRRIGSWPDGLNDQYLQGLENKYGLPRNVLYNVMMQESGGRSYLNGEPIKSSSGAEGLFQFMPKTAKDYGLSNPHDPVAAADAAARYYRDLLKKYNGNLEFALAAYNSGMGNVDKAIAATLANGGEENWGDVKNNLVTTSSNQKQVTDYVANITNHISQDIKSYNTGDTCYRNSEVNSAKDQIEGVIREIGIELRLVKKEELTSRELSMIEKMRKWEDLNRLGHNKSRTLEMNLLNEKLNGMNREKQKEILSAFSDIYKNNNIKKGDPYYLSVSLLEDVVQSLSAQGRAGNAFLSINMSKFINEISNNYDRLINSFDEEAYYDLQLGKRLGSSGLISENGEEVEDPRDINPMFFMESKPYIREDTLESGYSKASSELGKTMSQVSEAMSKVIKKSTSPIPGEYKLPQKPEYSEADNIKENLRKMTIIKAMKQAGNRLGGKEKRLDPDTISGARGSKGMNMIEQGVGDEDEQAEYFFPRSAQPFNRGINQAFPVIKVYLVEGDEDSIKENISNPEHEFYELTGLISVKISHQDDISPVDVALIRIANPGSVYSDQTVYMDMHKPSKNWKSGMDKTPNATNIPLNRLKLRPGNRIHIRGGYCVDEQTEILTKEGWKKYDTLKIGDTVYSLDHETGDAIWDKVEKVNIFEVKDEEMVSIEGQYHSSLTTENHKWPMYKYYSNDKNKKTNEWVLSKDIKTNNAMILSAENNSIPKNKTISDSFVELIAWFWTEGNIRNTGKNRNPTIRISQERIVNRDNCRRIKEVSAIEFGDESENIRSKTHKKWRIRERVKGNENVYTYNSVASSEILKVAPDRIVSREFILSLTKEQLLLFIEISNLGDGHNIGTYKDNGFLISQKDPRQLEAIEFAAILLGYKTRIYENNKIAFDRSGEPYRMTTLAVSYNLKTLGFSQIKPKRKKYSGVTWCPTTNSHTWLARRNGNVYFTGNSNDINKLETMFNGIVTEVEGDSTLYLVCESFGRELVMHDHGDDPTEDNWYGGADTLEVISNFLYAGEVEHFGNIKFFSDLTDSEGEGRRALTLNNIFSYAGSHALFINIYADEIVGGYDFGFSFWKGLLGHEVIYPKFPVYKITPWEALKEMEYRHPGSLAKPCNYGDRSTFFFGIKEQLYVYRDTADGIRKGINIGAGKNRRGSNGSLGRSNRLKPVSDFHIIASDFNIISNSLRVTNEFDTVVDIAYWTDQDNFKSKDFDWYTMKMDDNIRPMDHRNGRLQMNAINGKYSAFTYGSTHLKKEAEKMYDGKIFIIGNQNIKSGDYALLDDASRDLYGIIKIRECIQHFDTENGFITEIRPGLFAESSHTDYSFLFSKLGIGYSRSLSAARGISRHINRSGKLFAKFSLYVDLMGMSNSSGTSTDMFKKVFTRDGAAIVANQGSLAGITAYSGYRSLKWAKESSSILAQGLRIGGSAAQFASGVAVGGVKVAASATGAGEYISSLMARSSVLSTAMPAATGLLKVARAAGPIGWIGTIIMSVVSNYIKEESLTRQPIRMNYLQMGGKPYIGGIVGYHEGGYAEDLVSNIKSSLRNIKEITTKLGFL